MLYTYNISLALSSYLEENLRAQKEAPDLESGAGKSL